MKKYLLGLVALVMAISFSAFTTNHKKTDTTFSVVYWEYVGAQNSTARQDRLNYQNPSSSVDDFSCEGAQTYECAVKLNNVTGLPTNPPATNWANLTFDANGFPNGNQPGQTDFQQNFKRPIQ